MLSKVPDVFTLDDPWFGSDINMNLDLDAQLMMYTICAKSAKNTVLEATNIPYVLSNTNAPHCFGLGQFPVLHSWS